MEMAIIEVILMDHTLIDRLLIVTGLVAGFL